MSCRLRGRLPFDAEKDEDIKRAIISGSPDYNNTNFLSLSYNVGMMGGDKEQCRDAIKGLLQKNPDMRLSADDLMHHPWFTDMKTRMKVRPYKPKKMNLSPRLRRYEEEGESMYPTEENARVKSVVKYAEVKPASPQPSTQPQSQSQPAPKLVVPLIPIEQVMEEKPDIIPPGSPEK